MRVVVAPDKFKGSLTAVEAAEAIGGTGLGVPAPRRNLARSFAPPPRRKGLVTNRTPADSAQSC